MNYKLFTGAETFRQGVSHRAIQFSINYDAMIPFKIGYLLWGLDIWIGKVPMIKLMIGANIINMGIMWLVR